MAFEVTVSRVAIDSHCFSADRNYENRYENRYEKRKEEEEGGREF